MNLMLAALFLSVLIGLSARRFGRAQQRAIIAIAVGVTFLYTFFGTRFV